MIIGNLQLAQFNIAECSFFLRFKSLFNTYHSELYDKPFKSNSFVVSFRSRLNSNIGYGNIQIFVKYRSSYFVLIQKYSQASTQLDSFLDLPPEIKEKLRELFPLVSLTKEFAFLPVDYLQHKCVLISFKEKFCISEFRIDFEHD